MAPILVSLTSHAGRKKKQKQETPREAEARGQGCEEAGYIDVGGSKGEMRGPHNLDSGCKNQMSLGKSQG